VNVLIYAGPAPSREHVIQFSTPIAQHVATSLTLVIGGAGQQALLTATAAQLNPPPGVSVELRALPGNAQVAVLTAAREQTYDLVILGRLRKPLGRLLPGVRSTAIARRLEPSVLRVQGTVRPIRRILVASGGDHHTFADVDITARLAGPLDATVTLLHVVSEQSLLLEGLPSRRGTIDMFLSEDSPEAQTLRQAAAMLRNRGVPCELKGRGGSVLDEILAELRVGNYDMLVIGAHRVASALDRILLEDITNDLLDRSPLPVLVVKEPAA